MKAACTACGKALSFDEAKFGERPSVKVRCPSCKAVVELAKPSEVATSPPAAVAVEEGGNSPTQKLKRDEVLAAAGGDILLPMPQDHRVSLAILSGKGSGQVIHCERSRVIIGRTGADISLDDDEVSLSNLQRQVIHGTPEIGTPKVESAAATIRRLNPHVAIELHATRLVAANALDLVDRYDLVADGSDNFATRYLVSDACFFAKKPLVTAALGTFDGTLTSIRAHENAPDGKPNPTYRCLFPEPPPPELAPSCQEAGVLGVLPGIIGLVQAVEAVKLILGRGEPLVGRLLLYDALEQKFREVKYVRDPACPACGEHPMKELLPEYTEASCAIAPRRPEAAASPARVAATA